MPAAAAVRDGPTILYELTGDGSLQNPGGVWGGTLPTTAYRETNITLSLYYSQFVRGKGYFRVLGGRVTDNNTGTSSDLVLFDRGGEFGITYSKQSMSGSHWNTIEGGAISFTGLRWDYGAFGTPPPIGPDFDAAVEAFTRAPFSGVLGFAGLRRGDAHGWVFMPGQTQQATKYMVPGQFSFQSALSYDVLDAPVPAEIPLPASVLFLTPALAGLLVLRRCQRSTEH